MHPTDDQFTQMIDTIAADAMPRPARHRLVWFAAGTVLWLAAAIELLVLAWIVLHG